MSDIRFSGIALRNRYFRNELTHASVFLRCRVPYSPISIANAFLATAELEQRALTNMQLQKLVYFAHGWHLALKDEPLLNTDVKAWNFGPVIPPLYRALKQFGNGTVHGPIEKTGHDFTPPHDPFVQSLLQRVWAVYGHLTGGQMSTLTHEAGSPWDVTFKKKPFEQIPDDLISSHFKAQRKKE